MEKLKNTKKRTVFTLKSYLVLISLFAVYILSHFIYRNFRTVQQDHFILREFTSGFMRGIGINGLNDCELLTNNPTKIAGLTLLNILKLFTSKEHQKKLHSIYYPQKFKAGMTRLHDADEFFIDRLNISFMWNYKPYFNKASACGMEKGAETIKHYSEVVKVFTPMYIDYFQELHENRENLGKVLKQANLLWNEKKYKSAGFVYGNILNDYFKFKKIETEEEFLEL